MGPASSIPVVVAHRFEHQSEGVKPKRREVRRWVLRKVLRFVENFATTLSDELVYGVDRRPGLHHEREMLETNAFS